MELSEKTVMKLLEVIAEERNNAVAENVLMAIRQVSNELTSRAIGHLLGSVADGLGVPLE